MPSYLPCEEWFFFIQDHFFNVKNENLCRKKWVSDLSISLLTSRKLDLEPQQRKHCAKCVSRNKINKKKKAWPQQTIQFVRKFYCIVKAEKIVQTTWLQSMSRPRAKLLSSRVYDINWRFKTKTKTKTKRWKLCKIHLPTVLQTRQRDIF